MLASQNHTKMDEATGAVIRGDEAENQSFNGDRAAEISSFPPPEDTEDSKYLVNCKPVF